MLVEQLSVRQQFVFSVSIHIHNGSVLICPQKQQRIFIFLQRIVVEDFANYPTLTRATGNVVMIGYHDSSAPKQISERHQTASVYIRTSRILEKPIYLPFGHSVSSCHFFTNHSRIHISICGEIRPYAYVIL